MLETQATSPAERRRAETRREILDAAWALCREHGLAGLSLRDLAARVGMRAPSLYSYFGSKDAIYDAMFAQGQHQLDAHMDYDNRPVGDRRGLRDGSRAFFEFCVNDPVRYQLLFQRTLPGFEPSAESYALAVEQLAKLETALSGAGVRDRALLDLFSALITGLIAQQLSNEPDGDRWARLLDDAVDMFCDHAGIPPTDQPGADR